MDSGDEFQSLSSSNVSDNLGHTIRVLWPYIKSRVILHHVIAEMPCMSQASSEVYCCREDKEKVSEVFFQHLQAIDDPGKYQVM
ncbi:hypothetical protein PoB_005194700 [Plakobranchus ocellatus]|uniref:Uncharacterized protein n=1 Tax=Plakobranchus ocellatus TaxID=259542 RepID=A0AAV4C2F6_9GAST|nr:hypothetical protein PoB_005194700 [Plakobranchus ocellatus]